MFKMYKEDKQGFQIVQERIFNGDKGEDDNKGVEGVYYIQKLGYKLDQEMDIETSFTIVKIGDIVLERSRLEILMENNCVEVYALSDTQLEDLNLNEVVIKCPDWVLRSEEI